MRTLILAAFVFVLGAAAGCGARDHTDPRFGHKNLVFFKQQQVHADPAKGAPSGLDSEEAAAITRGYRKTLGAEEQRTEPSQVLMIQPPKGQP